MSDTETICRRIIDRALQTRPCDCGKTTPPDLTISHIRAPDANDQGTVIQCDTVCNRCGLAEVLTVEWQGQSQASPPAA